MFPFSLLLKRKKAEHRKKKGTPQRVAISTEKFHRYAFPNTLQCIVKIRMLAMNFAMSTAS